MKDKLKIQNALLVILETQNVDVEFCRSEMCELVRTANCKVALTVIQKRNSPDPVTVVGSGKLDEIKELLDANAEEIDVVVFANNLNAVQRRNIEQKLKKLVIDKTDLILDIFALHASSAEGKKQVELAQLSYSLATRSDTEYTRQGGGIGTRGPGETQLETDKRLAREKIHRLKCELRQLENRREVLRKPRKESGIFVAALVGYTNAGKSTLFNCLTDECVYADNKLFATLDTTVRKLKLPNGIEILLTDTVGFIKDLPHQLIDAFKSTLEETVSADLILNVCDISDNQLSEHISVTENMLAELGVTAPIIRVYNKTDKKIEQYSDCPVKNGRCVFVSALTGSNIDVLKDEIQSVVMKEYALIKLSVPFADSEKISSQLRKYASSFGVVYDEEKAVFDAVVRKKYLRLFAPYVMMSV